MADEYLPYWIYKDSYGREWLYLPSKEGTGRDWVELTHEEPGFGYDSRRHREAIYQHGEPDELKLFRVSLPVKGQRAYGIDLDDIRDLEGS